MYYVDGFVLAVPTAKKEAYRALAEQAAAVFKRHGALTVVECWGDPWKTRRWSTTWRRCRSTASG